MPTSNSNNPTTITDTIRLLRERQPRPRQYSPPSDADIKEAEASLGVPLPTDFITFLTQGHDLDVWTYKVKPNGDWDTVRHDIVCENQWRRQRGNADLSRLLIFCATGGDGGYDAFALPPTPTTRRATYPVVHFTYTDTGIHVTPLANSFSDWLLAELNALPTK